VLCVARAGTMNTQDLFQHLEDVVIRRGFAGALDVGPTGARDGGEALSEAEALSVPGDGDARPAFTKQRIRLVQMNKPHLCKHWRRSKA
jgi:hypothetical protein